MNNIKEKLEERIPELVGIEDVFERSEIIRRYKDSLSLEDKLMYYLEVFQEENVDWYIEEEGADVVDLAINCMITLTATIGFLRNQLDRKE